MSQLKIVVIDYGVGNIFSVLSAIRSLGYARAICSNNSKDIIEADKLILPGVGAFDACMGALKSLCLDQVLGEVVMVKKKPILGICVGMQLMADWSEENGQHHGLGWIPGRVVKIQVPVQFPVPHVGWNEISGDENSILFSKLGKSRHFYFDHSYHYQCDQKYISATCSYGIPITAAIETENICGVQFHPEISQSGGLKLLRSFFDGIN